MTRIVIGVYPSADYRGVMRCLPKATSQSILQCLCTRRRNDRLGHFCTEADLTYRNTESHSGRLEFGN